MTENMNLDFDMFKIRWPGHSEVCYELYHNPNKMPLNKVELLSYEEAVKDYKIPVKARRRVCYGTLSSAIKNFRKNNGKHPNRLITIFKRTNRLSSQEKKEWINLCVKYKMLPKYMSDKVIDKEAFIIKLDNHITPSQIFLYLSVAREIWKDPGLVKTILYLVNEKHINFYVAFVAASRFCLQGTSAHCTWVSRNYIDKDANMNSTIPLHVAIGLKRFASNPKRYDNRKFVGSSSLFQTSYHIIYCTNDIRCFVPLKSMFNNNINKVVNARTDEKAKEYASVLEPDFVGIFKNKKDKRRVKYAVYY